VTAAREKTREFTAGQDSERLDRFLADRNTGLSRSRLHSLIAEGMVTLNGAAGRPSQRVRAGDRVTLIVPAPRVADVSPQPIPLTVVYQDAELIVVDKPAGLSVHPGPGHPDGTLVNALLALCPDIQGVGGVIRPGIVHRLDKDTSGLMVVAKTEAVHRNLSEQIKARKVDKGYLALAIGVPDPPQGRIDAPISRDPRHRKRMGVVLGGRDSRTAYRVLERIAGYSLLELDLETGRTHQIRVHLAYLGHPLLGDGVYGKRSPLLERHFLHAHRLGFQHPLSGETLELRSELPPDLAQVVEELRREEEHGG
jgi:23S rRNA pseudouridine1911/1915/1917 synthase